MHDFKKALYRIFKHNLRQPSILGCRKLCLKSPTEGEIQREYKADKIEFKLKQIYTQQQEQKYNLVHMLKRMDKIQPKSDVNSTINDNIEQHIKQGINTIHYKTFNRSTKYNQVLYFLQQDNTQPR